MYEIFRGSQAICIKRTEIVLRCGISLFRRLLKPRQGVLITLWHASSGLIQDREITFRLGVTARGSKLHPFCGLRWIFLNAVARQVCSSKVSLSLKDALFGGHRVEFCGFLQILWHAGPMLVEGSQIAEGVH